MSKSNGKSISPFLRQSFVVSGVAVNIIGHGTVAGFTAVLFPKLKEADSEIQIDDISASWIASVVGFALLIGSVITPFIMEKWGRRTAHLLTTLPIAIGWFIIVTSHSVSAFIIGRLFQGISFGLLTPLCSILIGEYTSPKNRGPFLVAISLSISFGVLFVHTVGTFLHWQHTGLISVGFTLMSFVIVTFSPETPSWLASKGRYDECREVFTWLRGNEDDEENKELEAMLNARLHEFKAKEWEKLNRKADTGYLKTLFKTSLTTMMKKEFNKPIIVMIHLFLLMQFSGSNILFSYMVDVLRAFIGENSNVYFWMIFLDGQRLFANFFAIFLTKKIKRRTLLFSTGVLCIASLLSLTGYVYSKTMFSLTFGSTWIPIVLINLYMFSLVTGITSMPFTIAGEIFPVVYRSLGSSICTVFLSLMNFAAVKSAPLMFASIGVHGAFSVYAAIMTYSLIAVWFFASGN